MNRDFRVKKNNILICLAIIVSFKITILSYVSPIFTLLYVLLQVFILCIFVKDIYCTKGFHYIDVITFLFCVFGCVSTMINNLSLETWLLETISFLSMVYTAKWCITKNTFLYIQSVAKYVGSLTIINTLISIISYPGALLYDGFNPVFFLGGDNTSVRLYIIGLMFAVLAVNKRKRSKIYLFLLTVNFIAFAIIRDLGSGKICSSVMLIGIVIFVIMQVPMPRKSIKAVGIINFVLFVLLIVLNKVKIFSYIIITILHRDLTLTTRTTIWEITLDKIAEKPIFGNGYVTGNQFESMLPHIIGVNAHNTFLMIVYMGGIVLLIIFILIYHQGQKKYDNVKHKNLCNIFPIAIMAMMLRAQIEGGDAIYLMYLFHLISLSSKIDHAVEEGFRKYKYKIKA